MFDIGVLRIGVFTKIQDSTSNDIQTRDNINVFMKDIWWFLGRFDLLRDELALVLGEYVHLPLEDDFVGIEITLLDSARKIDL